MSEQEIEMALFRKRDHQLNLEALFLERRTLRLELDKLLFAKKVHEYRQDLKAKLYDIEQKIKAIEGDLT
jgi:hypothetical protein